jgi:ketosteroid isomerase-like protein
MKIRYLLALVGLAISFAVPVLGEEQNAVDPEVRQQIEAAYSKFAEAFDKHDAVAMADLYTQNAVEVWPVQPDGGLISGREAIVKAIMAETLSGFPLDHRIVLMYACGNDICAITEWSLGHDRGRYAVTIYVRDGDDWKIRMEYVN